MRQEIDIYSHINENLVKGDLVIVFSDIMNYYQVTNVAVSFCVVIAPEDPITWVHLYSAVDLIKP